MLKVTRMKIHFSKFKKIFIGASIFIFTMIPLAASAVGPYYFIRPLGLGDTIYFDNSSANWSTVKIYMFNSTDDTHPFEWDDRPSMTPLADNIWEYSVSADDDFYGKGYDYIVFSNDSGEQTINLGFVGNGYAYKVDAWQDGLRSGYWYLYDKSGITFQNVRVLKTGDVIYFDTAGTDWESPRIYLFSNIEGGSERFAWGNRPSMDHVSGTVYEYPITADLDIESYLDNYVIFTAGNNSAQTINLGFIDTGYAYKITGWQDGSGVGYWYVYNKSGLIDAVDEANAYLDGPHCTKEPKYALLLQSIANANLAIANEVPVETEVFGNVEEYWNQVSVTQNALQNNLSALKDACPVDPDEDPDEPDDPDTPDSEDDSSETPSADGTSQSEDGSDDGSDLAVPNTGANTLLGNGSSIAVGVGVGSVVLTITGIVLFRMRSARRK